MKYVIGIDSGATSSDVLIYIPEKNRQIFKKFQPININILGFDESAKRLISILKNTVKENERKNIISIAAGISGARNQKDRNKLELAVKKSLGLKNIKVVQDTEIAFASVFEPKDRNCGILIAGTGSILFFIDKNGKLKKIGGWGRHIGDEGSGYWIAREALYMVTKFYDGRGKATILAGILKKEFGIDRENIVKEIYHNNFEISKLTRFVFLSAEKGDPVSKQILKNAAQNLLEHLTPLKNRTCSIALTGSLFTEETLLEKYIKASAKEKFRNVRFIKVTKKPVWGAVKIAMSKYN